MMSGASSRAATLRLIRPDGTLAAVPLTRTPFRIGRHSDNDLVVDGATVSRQHVDIVSADGGHLLRDRQSKRGTFVNGRLVAEHRLRPGDVITLGRPDGGGIVYDPPALQPDPVAVLDDESIASVLRVVRPEDSRYLNTLALDPAALRQGPAVERLKTLYEITTVTLSARSVADLCRDVLAKIAATVRGERGWILLRNDDTGALDVGAQFPPGPDGDPGRPSRTVVSRVLDEHVAILSANAMTDARFGGQESIAGQAVRSVLCAPISSAHRVWGACYVDTRAGGAEFDADQLEFLSAACRQAGVALENLHLVEEQRRALESFIGSLTAAIDARDELTAGHSARVATNASAFASYLGKEPAEVRLVQLAGLLHDVGKIGTRDAVLQKPGRLTPDEFDHMKEHTRNTERILSRIRFSEDLQRLPAVAAAHHENLDGSGYSSGLRGDQIADLTRYISICDVFDALTSKRHYRDPMSLDETLQVIAQMAGPKFDPDLVAAFTRFVREGRWRGEA